MTENPEKILKFPKDADKWFVWRSRNGELMRFQKGRYVIIKMPDGQHEIQYVDPELGKLEDLVLEFQDRQIIEKRSINSRKDYEELLNKVEEINRLD